MLALMAAKQQQQWNAKTAGGLFENKNKNKFENPVELLEQSLLH